MQIIDIEAHFGPMSKMHRSFLTEQDLCTYMDTYGIQKVAAYHQDALRENNPSLSDICSVAEKIA